MLLCKAQGTHVSWPPTASCKFRSPSRLAAAVGCCFLSGEVADLLPELLPLPLVMLPLLLLPVVPMLLLPPILRPSMMGWQPLQTTKSRLSAKNVAGTSGVSNNWRQTSEQDGRTFKRSGNGFLNHWSDFGAVT